MKEFTIKIIQKYSYWQGVVVETGQVGIGESLKECMEALSFLLRSKIYQEEIKNRESLDKIVKEEKNKARWIKS